MDAVSFGLSTIDLCIKSGKKLYIVCQSYKDAAQEIRDDMFRIEDVWLKTESQCHAIQLMWHELRLDIQTHHLRFLEMLQERLELAVIVISSLQLNRVKYALYGKGKLGKILKDLEEWHSRFNPSWYLFARISASTFDQFIASKQRNPFTTTSKELSIIGDLRDAHRISARSNQSSDSLFLSTDISVQGRCKIANAAAETGYIGGRLIIVDSLSVSRSRLQVSTNDVQNMALTLAKVDPDIFSLLSCQGVIKVLDIAKQVTGFEFILAFPKNFEASPRSLRTNLLFEHHQNTLDDRFRLARQLARSISFLHSSQIVHKNISPETVLLLKNSQTGFDAPFLVGFEKFRLAESQTEKKGDDYWEKNLYRHPARQGEFPDDRYTMLHDIYSLGVCLLEIGLNVSLVDYNSSLISKINPKGAVPASVLDIAAYMSLKDVKSRATKIKKTLMAMAGSQLPEKMGKVYTNVVITCLTCLDKGNTLFGNESEFVDEDGMSVGVRYIEKILYQVDDFNF